MEVFQDYAHYYDLFYQDKNYRAETVQVDGLLRKYGGNINRILDLGCGTGKHDIEFSKMGYHCTGIDMSPIMIDMAKKDIGNNGYRTDFFVADIRDYELREKYDAVISLFHVMSYQNNNEDILAAFHTARKAIDKGGIFLFDVWYGPGVLSDKPSIRVKEIQDDKYRMIRVARPIMYDKMNTVDVCYEILIIEKASNITKVISETHTMRYFFRPELEYYLKSSGFCLVDNLDCETLEKTDFDTWTSYFVAKAI